VKVTLLRSALAAASVVPRQYLTSYVVDGRVAFDAGCLGFVGEPAQQALIKHVVLSHTHLDHIASLPIFLENVYDARPDCVTVYGSRAVLDCLQHDFFNGRVWPDFIALSPPHAPLLKLQELEAGRAFEVEGLHITPVPVSHTVPTLGFVIEGPNGAVIIVSDTGPTEEIWRAANSTPCLKGIFLEVAFPDPLARLADLSKHLTPRTFAAELRKLQVPARIIAVHLKARFQAEVLQELECLALPNVEVVEFGRAYEF
jgi:cAMP phosphodiesterase